MADVNGLTTESSTALHPEKVAFPGLDQAFQADLQTVRKQQKRQS